MKSIMIDYETFYKDVNDSDECYSVSTMGNWRYCNDSRFDPYLISAWDGESGWVGHPRDFNWEAVRGMQLLAHNAGFERAITRRQTELGRVPAWVMNDSKWQCTANMTSCLFSTRSLAESVFVAEGRRVSKEDRNWMNGKSWEDAVKAGRAQSLSEYALRDSQEGYNLFAKHGHRWSQFERDLSELTMTQCARGVAVDVSLLREYQVVLKEVIFHLEVTLPWTKRGGRPTSKNEIAEECRTVGIPVPGNKGKKGSDEEEAYILWERTYRDRFPWVTAACVWRSLNKLLSSLETLEHRLRPDGTVDFSLLYFGGHTGRWSGGGGGFNMQNLRKEPLYLLGRAIVEVPAELQKPERKAELKDWLKDKYIFDIRRLFIARPGKKFIICDLSQVEPRVLNWLAGNREMLDAMANGYSYYEAYARLYKGWNGGKGTLKKQLGGVGYTLLKNEALGLGFGMGAERYIDYAGVDEATAVATVDAFRNSNKLIAGTLEEGGLWRRLENELFKSVNDDYEIQLPSGRSLFYRAVRRETKMKRNDEGKYESRTVTTVSEGVKRKEVYGGKLAENVTQAVARDVFGTHLLALEKNIGDVIFHVHDEAITEVDLDVTPRDVEHVMSATPDWLPGCPLSAEAQESMHYLK